MVPGTGPMRAGRCIAVDHGGQFTWHRFQLAQTIVVFGDTHPHATPTAHLRLILEVPRARRGNHYVSIAFHQILLAIVKRGQRHIAQHVVKRPDEGRRARALEIFLDRCDENVVKVLRLRLDIFFWVVSRQSAHERKHFAAQRDLADRYFARHPRCRRNHHHDALIVQHQSVDRRRSGPECSHQRFEGAGLIIDGFHLAFAGSPLPKLS